VRATSGTTCCGGLASRGEGFKADTTSACLQNQLQKRGLGQGEGKAVRSGRLPSVLLPWT
jgi:hypothetical protein